MARIPKTKMKVDVRQVRAKMSKVYAAMVKMEKARDALNLAINELSESQCVFEVADGR